MKIIHNKIKQHFQAHTNADLWAAT